MTRDVGSGLRDKVAVVTGAASGIGLAVARALVESGARVVLADRDERVRDVARGLGAEAAVGVVVDVSSGPSVEALVAEAESRFGAVHVLCNNAGINVGGTPLHLTEDDLFDRMVAVNLRGVFLGMKHAVPAIIRSGGGSVVNMSSSSALLGTPGQAAYTATKGGVLSLTRTAAVEYASRGVRVNAVCPGVVETPMWDGVRDGLAATSGATDVEERVVARHPIGRLGRAEEVAAAVLFLAGDASSFVTGTVLPVDGGMAAR